MVHLAPDRFAPRALLRRPTIPVELTPSEFFSTLIEALEARALRVAEDPDLIDAADFLFGRVAELRAAGR
jgi:hypothetical protein